MKYNLPPNSKLIEVQLTGIATILKPVIYVLDGQYNCWLPVDVDKSLVGVGNTPEKAINSWDEKLKFHLATTVDVDEILKYVFKALYPPNFNNDLVKRYGVPPLDKHILS